MSNLYNIPWQCTEYFYSLRRFVANRMTRTDARIEEGLTHVDPIIEERRKLAKELGQDWNDKPVRPAYIHHANIGSFTNFAVERYASVAD